MISKQYFEETFSLATAQALQEWANNNLIVQGVGDYGMKIAYNGNASMFAETEITGLTIGDEYTLTTNTIDDVVNRYRTKINALPNDNTSMVSELGYGTGQRTLLFTATEEIMYIAIGDENSGTGIYVVVDNISLKIDGVEAVSNGTFEAGNTNGWYVQTTGDATLTAIEYNVEPPVSDNPYIEPINIPVYDSGNATHVRIPTNAPFTSATFNNASYSHFYIEPGTHSGQPTITTSGSGSNRKTISAYATDIHPGKLQDNERAKIDLKFTNASYWTVSGVSATESVYHDVVYKGNMLVETGSNNIIFDQMLFGNACVAISLENNTDSCTIQKCYFDSFNSSQITEDVSFILFGLIWKSTVYATNHKVILNEFKNFKPIKLHGEPDTPNVRDYQGTIIDENVAWYDGDVYCDNDGTPNPSGNYAFAETGWGGTKDASFSETNPVIYSNNVLWGCKPTHKVNPPAGLSSPAPGFSILYFNAKNIREYGNVVAEAYGGATLTSNSGSVECENAISENNIIYQCGNINGVGASLQSTSLRLQNAVNCIVANNVVKDPIGAWAITSTAGASSMGNNDIINKDLDNQNNGGSLPADFATNNFLTTTEGNAKYTIDYVIPYYKYTNSPTTKTIPNVLEIDQEQFKANMRALA